MNGYELKKMLETTLVQLKANEIQIAEATAVAALSKEIVRITNTQLKITEYAQTLIPERLLDFSTEVKKK